jgi:hypothetical protein
MMFTKAIRQRQLVKEVGKEERPPPQFAQSGAKEEDRRRRSRRKEVGKEVKQEAKFTPP